MNKQPSMCFSVQLRPIPGFTLHQMRELERRIEDYADEHELVVCGHHYAYDVTATDLSILTLNDQVEFIDWLTYQDGISAVRVTALREQFASPPEGQGFLVLQACDPVTIGLKLLYSSGRIGPELYLQILGGFVRPMAVREKA